MKRCFALALIVALLASASGRAEANGDLTALYSKDGVLTATLIAAAGKVRVGDLELDALTYNGDYAGPVLHVHPGDLMRIKLVNNLAEPTNLHFHGMRSSPLGNGDNPHLLIQPDHSLDYEVRVPLSQPIGLYWYHAHVHHLAEHQTMGGLTGTFIVESPAPGAQPFKERLFVLKDMVFEDDTGNPEIDDTLNGVVQSVNGQLTTAETMQPGETQLWRFTNQSANRLLHIALAGHRFQIVGRDGEPHAKETVDVLDIPAGSRFDVLVDSGEAGHYALVTKGVMTGTGSARQPDRLIATLDVAGDTVPNTAATPAKPLPADLRTARIDAQRTVAFTETTTIKAEEQRFFINGQIFDPARTDFRVPLGNIEEWTIRNDSDDLHVFHIHQIGFQVVEVNGKPVPFTGYMDNVLVPERGEVKLRMPFTSRLIVGRFVFHCHVLKHEDAGMMANIEIYDPTPPTLSLRLNRFYLHIVWWWNGVPWSLCGLPEI